MKNNCSTHGLICFAALLVAGCGNNNSGKGSDNYKIVYDTVVDHRIDTMMVQNPDGTMGDTVVESYDTIYKADTITE